ncbi:hypothetical protein OAN24_06580, partial [Pseudodesulfovibrio sp.]|nr:hypothetical protein [Pseudodesulfovibrio sp.]
VHDLFPKNATVAERERQSTEWNGDVWKVAYDVHHNYPAIDFITMPKDFGVGVFWKKDEDLRYQPCWRQSYIDMDFSRYENEKDEFLHVVEPEPATLVKVLRQRDQANLGVPVVAPSAQPTA